MSFASLVPISQTFAGGLPSRFGRRPIKGLLRVVAPRDAKIRNDARGRVVFFPPEKERRMLRLVFEFSFVGLGINSINKHSARPFRIIRFCDVDLLLGEHL